MAEGCSFSAQKTEEKKVLRLKGEDPAWMTGPSGIAPA